MPTHTAIKLSTPKSKSPRNLMGGNPILPKGQELPRCRNCGEKQLLFFQFDIEDRLALPFESGSHLVVMMCPKCNDIPSFNYLAGGTLPPAFWNSESPHAFAALWPPGTALAEVETHPYLKPFELTFVLSGPSDPAKSLRVGGDPRWLQDPLAFVCACGAPMRFLCQLSENLPFPTQAGAPPQPNSFSKSDYCLCLGNEIYVFVCSKRCSARAVWIATQS